MLRIEAIFRVSVQPFFNSIANVVMENRDDDVQTPFAVIDKVTYHRRQVAWTKF